MIVDIEHPDNWNKLFVKINRDDLFKIQVKYEDFKSDWIDISHNAMNQSETQGKLSTEWYNIILHFCNNDEFPFEEGSLRFKRNTGQLPQGPRMRQRGGRVNTNNKGRLSGRTQNNPKGKPKK